MRLVGHDLRDYTLDDLRRRIALVAQDTYLFNDTLRANIMLARPGASDAALADALERAALSEFVAACRTGSTPSSASAARSCRAASASGSRSPARSSRTRRC